MKGPEPEWKKQLLRKKSERKTICSLWFVVVFSDCMLFFSVLSIEEMSAGGKV